MSNDNNLQKGKGMSTGIKTIWEAAAENDVEALHVSLKHYDINAQDERGMTALHHAAGSLAKDTVRELLNHFNSGLDVTIEDKLGRTATCMPMTVWGIEQGKELTRLLERYECPELFDDEDDEPPKPDGNILNFPTN